MEEYFATDQANDILRKLNADRLEGGDTCDIKLKCDEKLFHAHKNVLSQVSEYFKKLFYSEMQEKYQEKVRIKEVDVKIFQQIMDFIYTAKILIVTDSVFELLNAANYLLMKELQEFCCNFILKTLDLDNSVQVWLNVQEYRIKSLKDGCDKFVKENFAKLTDLEAINMNDVKTLKLFLGTRCRDTKGEETAFRFTVDWVYHNWKEGKSLFPQLFELIDLKVMRHEFLAYVVANEELVKEFRECLIEVAENTKYFLCPDTITMLDTKQGAEKVILDLNESIQGRSFIVCNNYLYMIGGYHDHSCLVLRKDLRFPYKIWKEQAFLGRGRVNPGLAVLNGFMYVIGNQTKERLHLDNDESEWWFTQQLKKCTISSNNIVSCKEMINAMQDDDENNFILIIQQYDPVAETTTTKQKQINMRFGDPIKLIAMDDQLYILSNCTFVKSLSLEQYDPESGESHDVSEITNVGEFRDACAAHGEIIVSFVSKPMVLLEKWRSDCKVVRIHAYNLETKEWRVVTESQDTTKYNKLVPLQSNPFESDCEVVPVEAYNFETKEWRVVTESQDTTE